jgi:hypothetical protein
VSRGGRLPVRLASAAWSRTCIATDRMRPGQIKLMIDNDNIR